MRALSADEYEERLDAVVDQIRSVVKEAMVQDLGWNLDEFIMTTVFKGVAAAIDAFQRVLQDRGAISTDREDVELVRGVVLRFERGGVE